jgi:hypothetical protein
MNSIIKWVWQDEKYPSFPFDSTKLDQVLTEVARNTGKLEGTVEALSDQNITGIKIETSINEILASSAI